MGASITDKGGTDWLLQLSRMRKGSREIIEKALRSGANIMADELRSATASLPVDEHYAKSGEMISGIKQAQKDGLLAGFGISPVDSDSGTYDVHVGWEGYNSIVTKRWPKGQPNAMIARSVNAGTYFMRATPFIDRTRSKCKRKSEQAMENTIAEEIGKITNGG